ncbi:MAG: DUF166 family (seleno)protein DfsP [Thermodesulfobacteriota bacterium]
MHKSANTSCSTDSITVFQQANAGEKKVQGIETYGCQIKIVEVIDFPIALPDFLDDPQEFFPDQIKGNIVLSFLKHPDLADYAAKYCQQQEIPMIASGPRKISGAHSPFTCCGLAKKEGLGRYGQQFGTPEYKITLEDKKIASIQVLRGASCGATWNVLPKILRCSPEEALEKIAREVQFLCQADPSSFDPVSGHSPLHFAGNIHTKALEKAIKEATE